MTKVYKLLYLQSVELSLATRQFTVYYRQITKRCGADVTRISAAALLTCCNNGLTTERNHWGIDASVLNWPLWLLRRFILASHLTFLIYLLTPYCPSRMLRSSYSSNLLQVPRTNLTCSRSFRAAAPTIWNSLPDSLRLSETFHSFRRHLKTHLYQPAFNTP